MFERIAPPEDWDAIANLEMLTNPRLRQEWGEISLVPVERRVSGPGATWVMAAFTHLNPSGSRFTDGSYGVYYASKEIETAIAETAYHMGLFYTSTSDEPHREDMRVLLGAIDATLHDIRDGSTWESAYDPTDYSNSQTLALALRAQGSDGIVYNSVRRSDGENIAAFWPDVVSIPIQGDHLAYEWNGRTISRYFDYQEETWVDL